jgi:type II restriction enzyme
LAQQLNDLTSSQLDGVVGVFRQFKLKPAIWLNTKSDLVSPCVGEMFGDALQIHHCFSKEALSKDRFEYTLQHALRQCGVQAELARKGNPGHDLTVNGVPVSLKTQADKGIDRDFVHISKFMELGKGKWKVKADLYGLRDRFLKHMKSYERILQLRRLTDTEALQEYELVEIPKELLRLAENGTFKMMMKSRQNPKPGTCIVKDKDGRELFELYFDGGTERKLQIRRLDKSCCVVHASWKIRRVVHE